jgi:hypothetical protein
MVFDAGDSVHDRRQGREAVQDGAQRAPGSGQHDQFGLVFTDRATVALPTAAPVTPNGGGLIPPLRRCADRRQCREPGRG